MLLGTVRRKLAALVGFSALAAIVVLPLLWWLMHRELIDEVDDRIPEAIHGFEEELGDDLKDLDVTARALSEQADTERAIATGASSLDSQPCGIIACAPTSFGICTCGDAQPICVTMCPSAS